MLNGSIAL